VSCSFTGECSQLLFLTVGQTSSVSAVLVIQT